MELHDLSFGQNKRTVHIILNIEGLAKRQSSPGNLNTEPANQSEAMTDPDRPISLVKSPERVHSECISTKSSKRSVEDGGAAGRTKSLPLTACELNDRNSHIILGVDFNQLMSPADCNLNVTLLGTHNSYTY